MSGDLHVGDMVSFHDGACGFVRAISAVGDQHINVEVQIVDKFSRPIGWRNGTPAASIAKIERP